MNGRIAKLLLAALLTLLGPVAHASGTVTYVYTDPQGTPLAEADASGTITATFDYKPYGGQALGSPKAGAGYTGHVNDPDTGFVYMQARYYDPGAGRFLSVDPIAPGSGNSFNFGRYDYANNNPARYIDPNGQHTASEGDGFSASECAAYHCEETASSSVRARYAREIGKKMEDYVGRRLNQALAADGVAVLKQVKISAQLSDGRVVDAIADFAYKINGRIYFHEVKFGLSAKLSVNQKQVYAAISEGRVSIASRLAASRLGVSQGVMLDEAEIVLEATENSRAWAQFGRYVGGSRLAFKMATGAVANGVFLFFHTDDVSHYDALMDECPACVPSVSTKVN